MNVNHLEHVLVQRQCQPQFILLWVGALSLIFFQYTLHF